MILPRDALILIDVEQQQNFPVSSSPQPNSQDLVLGTAHHSPMGADPAYGSAILGGFAGIQARLKRTHPRERIAALQCVDRTYPREGLPSLIAALQDPDLPVQKVAYRLLLNHPEVPAQAALQDYSPYHLFTPITTLIGHTAPVKSVAFGCRQFSVRSPQAIALSADSMGRVIVWDLATGVAVEQLQTWTFAYGLAYDSDRDWVLIRTAQAQLIAWSLKTLQEVDLSEDQSLQPDSFPVISGIASTQCIDDRYLAFSNQRQIKIWDKQIAKEIAVLNGHKALVNAIAWSTEREYLHRQYLLSGSEDKIVLVWGIQPDVALDEPSS
jgi:WD40 repeat protein